MGQEVSFVYITLFCKSWVLEQPTQVRILIKKSVHLQSWLSNIVLTLHRSDSDDPNRRGKRQKKGSSGLLACLPLSDALVKFLGTGENSLSRAGAVKRMWEYIKQNDLQVWCCFLVKPMLKWSVTLFFPPFDVQLQLMHPYRIELLTSLYPCLLVEKLPFDPLTICGIVSPFLTPGEKTSMHINSARWATEILKG